MRALSKASREIWAVVAMMLAEHNNRIHRCWFDKTYAAWWRGQQVRCRIKLVSGWIITSFVYSFPSITIRPNSRVSTFIRNLLLKQVYKHKIETIELRVQAKYSTINLEKYFPIRYNRWKITMRGKNRLLCLAILIAVALLVYLLLPLSSGDYRIVFDRRLTAYKEEHLQKLREKSVVDVPDSQMSGSVGSVAEEDEPAAPTNILLIVADDLGKTDISLYGGPHVHTPNIDTIGEEGVVFTEAYCTSPICSPSRAGMLTGRYQQRYGFEVQPQNRYPKNRLEYLVYKLFIDTGDWVLVEPPQVPKKKDVAKQGLPPSEITLGELLSAVGYSTGLVGKWHLGFNDQFIPNNRGFDYQYGFYEAFSLYAPVDHPDIVNYRHDYFANKHIWSQERNGSCAIRRNHTVIREDEYLTTRIAEEAVSYMEEKRENPFFLFVSFSAPHTPFQAPREYYSMFSHVEDKNKRVYYAMIKALDDGVGMIMEKLKELDLEEETLVLFASDNGGATYTGATDNAPLKGGKFTNFEGGINIPFMMRWKGVIPSGTVFNTPVSLLDVFTTAAAAAEAPLPTDRPYDGVDLIPFCTGEKTGPPHPALYWRAAYNKAVRSGTWKLIIDEQADRTILYDIESDKTEQHNLAEQYPSVVEELKSRLSTWERPLPGPLWPRVMDYRFEIDGQEFLFAL